MKKINELKKNDFFKRKDGAKKVFIVKGFAAQIRLMNAKTGMI